MNYHRLEVEVMRDNSIQEVNVAYDVIDDWLEMDTVIKQLRGAMDVADERMLAATVRCGILYTGCDTPDYMADEIIRLREELTAWREDARRLDEIAKKDKSRESMKMRDWHGQLEEKYHKRNK